MARRGIFTSIKFWVNGLLNMNEREPGRRTRAVARRGGTAYMYSPWARAGFSHGRRRGHRYRVRGRRG